MTPHEQGAPLPRRRFLAAGAASAAGTLAVPSDAGAQPAAAVTTYSLSATNNSSRYQDFCLYQKAVDLGVPGAVSLAWMTQPARAGATVTFTWTVVYNFFWASTGPLTSGGYFVPAGTLDADPGNPLRNRTGFGFGKEGYGFVAASGDTPVGTLEIDVLPDVPDATTSVGIGMDSSSVFAVQADPGANLRFTLRPDYWIAAGTFSAGEILDVEEITVAAEVPFDGTLAMHATLGPDEEWTVSAA
ncbi:hypothetical protein ACFXJM_13590 [Streptomyces massasporeus]